MTNREIMDLFEDLYHLETDDYRPIDQIYLPKGQGIIAYMKNGDRILYFPGKDTILNKKINEFNKINGGPYVNLKMLKSFLKEFQNLDELKEHLEYEENGIPSFPHSMHSASDLKMMDEEAHGSEVLVDDQILEMHKPKNDKSSEYFSEERADKPINKSVQSNTSEKIPNIGTEEWHKYRANHHPAKFN